MRKLRLFLVAIVSVIKLFAQDPSCEYTVIFKDVQTAIYTYKIMINDEYSDTPLDFDTDAAKITNYGWTELKSSGLSTTDSEELIAGYLYHF